MPRLSLYRPEKGNDYKFIDKTVWEMFQVGGTDVYVHKFIGTVGSPDTASPTTPNYSTTSPTNIQDLLLLENRDRKYDPDVYILRGVYNIQDIDFNLSQFGLFLQNDTIFITFHINDTVEKLGRKIISGDVIELPHLKDEWALNDLNFALKRYYVIEEVNRAAEGFSATWYPHLYRAKCTPMPASQEYADILNQVMTDSMGNPDPNGATVGSVMSTYEKEMQITAAVLNQAEADAPKSGYDTHAYWTIQKDPITGNSALVTVDSSTITGDNSTQATDINGNPLFDENGNPIYAGVTAATVNETPDHTDYPGYLVGTEFGPNGAPFTSGIIFPIAPVLGQFCLRTDYKPNRMFRFDGVRWVVFKDDVRMTMSNLGANDVGPGDSINNVFQGKDVRQTYKTTFINNDTTSTINGHVVEEKQSLSKALRPKADN